MSRRHTVQKQMIGETLARLDHPTATEIYEEIRRAYPQISLGTVYRNLSQMADDGEILRISFSGEPDRFDPNSYEHYHIACSCCGKICDTDQATMASLIEQIDRAVEDCTGIKVEKRIMIFSGICAECQSAAQL
ncbi:Fur family transcriptional regulator [Clostridium aminobutyricum]|uniref:Transcriptional repressor n=1 Tax=Clostridium aminobutyricum TaxID=33953 RepID=A0A939DAM3_CLOAM|nr:transcriptional repressor [Clostridium aminobutyricum]MBN7773778.1 transcriptional repressor [Clostridium aminobutyricum]